MSDMKISIPGGESKRLLTGGKYCSSDIVVTAEGEKNPIDLTKDTVSPDTVFKDITFHGADGKAKIGTFTITSELAEQDTLIAQIKSALSGKAGGGAGLPTQEKTVEITENGEYEVVPDTGYTLSKVAVSVDVPIPEVEDPRDQYQRVEYIESAEEETYPYIITDFVADNSCGMEVIASFPIFQDRIPMGSREDNNATRFYCVYPMSANSIYYGFNTGSSVSCPLKVDTIYRLQTNFLNSRLINVYDEDGIRKGGASISATLTQQSVPVSIFGYHSASSGTVNSKREYKLYSARCSRGHEVVREYIPCYRKSDGVVGLYEKCTGQFLTPETGTFAKSADIEW